MQLIRFDSIQSILFALWLYQIGMFCVFFCSLLHCIVLCVCYCVIRLDYALRNRITAQKCFFFTILFTAIDSNAQQFCVWNELNRDVSIVLLDIFNTFRMLTVWWWNVCSNISINRWFISSIIIVGFDCIGLELIWPFSYMCDSSVAFLLRKFDVLNARIEHRNDWWTIVEACIQSILPSKCT